MKKALALLLLAPLFLQPCQAAEELITTARYPGGEQIPYILDSEGAQPGYVIILFPGGAGTVDPRMENGKLVYAYGRNFLLRSRKFIVDGRFATVTTNSSQSERRIQAVLDDIKIRFPAAKIYLMGTSSGTYSTMALAPYLSDKIAGVIHTSSLNQIYGFDSRKYKNRQLIVHHEGDVCQLTLFGPAKASHERFGTDFIVMKGGISTGDHCEAFSHHGYNGIERETVEAIKKWILQGG